MAFPSSVLRRTWAVLRVLGRHLWPKGETGLRCRVVVATGAADRGQGHQRLRPGPLQARRRCPGRAHGPGRGRAGRPDPGLWRGPRPGPGVRRIARRGLRAGRRSARSATSRSRSSTTSMRSRCASTSSARPAGLSRVIERGTNGMEFLIRFTTFNILPTLFEIAAGRRDPVEPLRLALLGGDAGRRRRLCRLLGHPVGMAHQVRAPHERRRHRGQRQGDRQPAELRDGEVLRQRGARGAPLRRRPRGATRRPRSAPAAPCRCSTSARAPSSPSGWSR